MSSAHEISRERQTAAPAIQQNAPEVPRRPRSTTTTTLGSSSSGLPSAISTSASTNSHGHSNQQQQPLPPQPAVREIHKNAWLKRIAPHEKKGAPFVKKYDKLWVVFCVHDDAEAFLEFYSEPKMGATHRPNSYVSLNSCLHVSPSIIGQENNEYQFAVTLSTHVIRLVAANWDQMIEWVESLQGKLREMNVLSPKDNLYSKLPETRNFNSPHGFVSTRDPNSPLPPTPNGLQSPVLGTEASLYLPVSPATINLEHESSSGSSLPSNPSRPSSNVSANSSSDQYASTSIYVHPSSRDGSGSDSGNGSGGSIMSIMSSEPRVTIFPISVSSSTVSATVTDLLTGDCVGELRPNTPSPSVSVVTGNHNSTVVQVGSDENEDFSNERLTQSASATEPRTSFTPNAVYAVSQKVHSRRLHQNHSFSGADNRTKPLLPIPRINKGHPEGLERQHSAPSRPNSSSSDNVYEHLFIPEAYANGSRSGNSNINPVQGTPNGNVSSEDVVGSISADVPPAVPRRDLHKKLNSNSQRSSSLNRLEEQNGSRNNSRTNSSRQNQIQNGSSRANQEESNHRVNHKEIAHQRLNLNGIVNTNATPFIHIQGLEGEPMEALIGVRSGEYRIRREEVIGTNSQHENEVSAPSQQRNPVSHGGSLMSHVPLKEQQVMRLRAEINHLGGVRVVLRKKDCVNSIAFVDYLGAVWVAGWKQQQHPVLYYAFHVGDQIMKVAGATVQSSVEANRAIKMASSLQIEFIIRRVPHGNVFVLKRSREGEPLGLVVINNTPEVGEVLRDGLSASQGLPSSCRGTDGQLNCTWFLTEVNNRPLNLFARENEVRDRLNAVGKEISILVQPSDLAKHLRKQLKSMKGFKDYLVV